MRERKQFVIRNIDISNKSYVVNVVVGSYIILTNINVLRCL